MIFNTEFLAWFVVAAAVTGAASSQLELFMRQGMILSFWLDFWALHLAKFTKDIPKKQWLSSRKDKFGRLSKSNYETLRNMAGDDSYCSLYKPLGGCVYCMNIWLASSLFTAASLLFLPSMGWYACPICVAYCLFSGGFVRIFYVD